MPLYEYECQTEKTRFEVIQKFSDSPVEVCPNCGGPVKRLLSSPAIQFKGTGWYITDYARKGSTDAGRESGKDSGKDGGKDSTKDSKSSATSGSDASSSKPSAAPSGSSAGSGSGSDKGSGSSSSEK